MKISPPYYQRQMIKDSQVIFVVELFQKILTKMGWNGIYMV